MILPDVFKKRAQERLVFKARPLDDQTRRDGVGISLFTVIATFGTEQDVTADELRIDSLFPADEATERLFRSAANEK